MSKLLLLLLVSACSLIPDLSRTGPPVPETLPGGLGPHVKLGKNKKLLDWKGFYDFPELQNLINISLKNNRDLRIAAFNVEEIRSQYRIRRSAYFPEISVNGSWLRRRIPENALFQPGGAGGGVGGRTSESFIQNQYALEVGITSYELDFFGRFRSLERVALEEFLASEAARETVRISLISEVASTYLRFLTNRELIKLARMTSTSQEETVELIRNRFKAGVASELDVSQAETLLESARADAIAFEREVALDKNALELLVGTRLKESELTAKLTEAQKSIRELPISLDSSILLLRPDIRRAERLLHAANANIGAARAAFFPSISLTTSIGKLSTETSNLFDRSSDTWSFIPQIRLPIFTGGRLRAELDLAKVRKERSIAQYEQAIQNAFREASDALVSNEKLFQLMEAQKRVLNVTQKSYEISHARYISGVTNYLAELDALRSLYGARRNFLNQQLLYFSNLTFLYRALGGGVK